MLVPSVKAKALVPLSVSVSSVAALQVNAPPNVSDVAVSDGVATEEVHAYVMSLAKTTLPKEKSSVPEKIQLPKNSSPPPRKLGS